MSIDYNYSNEWIGRDTQPENSPLRVIKAEDFLNEWTSIQTAFTKAAPSVSPTFTGTLTAETVTATTLNATDLNISGSLGISGYNNTEWDEAYSWGDHSTAGYLTSFTELDPTVPAHVKAITEADIASWDLATGIGDINSYGFLTSVEFSDIEANAVTTSAEAWTNVDNQLPTNQAVENRINSKGYITGYTVTEADVTQYQSAINSGVSITESQISDFGGGGSYLTDAPSDGSQYARKDGVWSPITGASGGTVTSVNASAPVGLSVSGGPITTTGTLAFSYQSGYAIPTTAKQSNWDTAYSWGNHANAGYVPTSGSGATGTWGINITGNADTATTATNCTRTISAGSNLTGGGALTSNRTISLSSTLTSLTDVQTNNVSIGSWDIQLDGSDLRFRYNNTDVFRITTTGSIIAKGEVTAYGSP